MFEKLVPAYIKEEVDKVVHNTTGHRSYGALCGGVFSSVFSSASWLLHDVLTPYPLPLEFAS